MTSATSTQRNYAITVALCATAALVAAVPTASAATFAVNIHGSLTGPDGSPLTGARAYRVRFFDDATAGSQLGSDLTGSVTLSSEGLFNIPVYVPWEAIEKNDIWYELAIDTDTPVDGDATDDVFPDRIKVAAVPYALMAENVMGVEATTIADGSVDDTEFQTLDGVTASIQTQLDAKAASADVYTKTEVDTSQTAQNTAIAAKADSADVYTKTEADGRYLQTESDTLATVTARGAATDAAVALNGGLNTTTVQASGNISTSAGSVVLPSAGMVYLGDPATEGTWRIVRSSDSLAFERFESSAWVSKMKINP